MRPLPWKPLFSIERSGITEVTRSGIICLVDGDNKAILSLGDSNYELWSRSCLKSFQLLSHLHVLQKHYPSLQPYHYALMASSHSGEDIHLSGVREILAIGDVDASFLKCPPAYPLSPEAEYKAQAAHLPKTSLFNNCSGKHAGYLLAMKANGYDLSDYTNANGPQFTLLKRLLAYLLGKNENEFAVTVDGCRLPNYALSPRELAYLYVRLQSDFSEGEIKKAPEDVQVMLKNWGSIRQYMSQYPEMVSGKGRLDARLMQKEFVEDKSICLLAKQGADGMLSISLSANKQYPRGLGIVIKDAGGNSPLYQELIVEKLFSHLNLKSPSPVDEFNKHLTTTTYFAGEEDPTASQVSANKQLPIGKNS